MIRDSSFNGFTNNKLLLGPSPHNDESSSSLLPKKNEDSTFLLKKNNTSSSSRHHSSSSSRHHNSSSGRHQSSSGRHENTGGNRNNVRSSRPTDSSNYTNTESNRLLFVVDTINDGRGSRHINSPTPTAPSDQNFNPGYANLDPFAYAPVSSINPVNNSPIPSMPRAPRPSNLSTPSTMSPLFPPSNNSPLFPPSNNSPIPSYSSPLPSVNSQRPVYSPSLYSQYTDNREYFLNDEGRFVPVSSRQVSPTPNSNTSNYNNTMGYPCAASGSLPLNPARVSTSTTKGELGFNGSNERL
jgi:hypothetical protein